MGRRRACSSILIRCRVKAGPSHIFHSFLNPRKSCGPSLTSYFCFPGSGLRVRGIWFILSLSWLVYSVRWGTRGVCWTDGKQRIDCAITQTFLMRQHARCGWKGNTGSLVLNRGSWMRDCVFGLIRPCVQECVPCSDSRRACCGRVRTLISVSL